MLDAALRAGGFQRQYAFVVRSGHTAPCRLPPLLGVGVMLDAALAALRAAGT
jgi:hypothetical protein